MHVRSKDVGVSAESISWNAAFSQACGSAAAESRVGMGWSNGRTDLDHPLRTVFFSRNDSPGLPLGDFIDFLDTFLYANTNDSLFTYTFLFYGISMSSHITSAQ